MLQALNKNSGPFTSIDEQHIQLFGVHLGNTLSKSRFFEEAKYVWQQAPLARH